MIMRTFSGYWQNAFPVFEFFEQTFKVGEKKHFIYLTVEIFLYLASFASVKVC